MRRFFETEKALGLPYTAFTSAECETECELMLGAAQMDSMRLGCNVL